MIWTNYHHKFFDFKFLADEALLNKLINDAVRTDEFKKLKYLNVEVRNLDSSWVRTIGDSLIQYSYDANAPEDPKWVNVGRDPKKGYYIDANTDKRIVKRSYFSFHILKSLLHFKFKYNIPYYGTEFFSTPFHWIEEEYELDIYEKYNRNPSSQDYKRYGHIGKVAEISIIDDRLESLDSTYGGRLKRFSVLKKVVKNKYGVELISDSEVVSLFKNSKKIDYHKLTLEQYFTGREKFAVINPSDKFFRQFCIKIPARLVALDLGYFICKHNYDIYRFLENYKVNKITYTINLFEFDIKTFSNPIAQETFKIIIKEVVKYLTEIFTNRAFINFEMNDFKFEYTEIEIFPAIKITDPLENSFVIRFDFWNMNREITDSNNIGYGSIKNNYEDSYPNEICGKSIGFPFTFWSPIITKVYDFKPHKIDFEAKDQLGRLKFPEWWFWRDYKTMLYHRFLGAYYHKEPVEIDTKSSDYDIYIMREYFENYLIKYLENINNFKYYYEWNSLEPLMNRSWVYGRHNLSFNQISWLDVPCSADLARPKRTYYIGQTGNDELETKVRKANEEFREYYTMLIAEDNFMNLNKM